MSTISPFDQFPSGRESDPFHADLFSTAEGIRFQEWIGSFDTNASLSTLREFNHTYDSRSGSSVNVYMSDYPYDDDEAGGYIHFTVLDGDRELEMGELDPQDERHARDIFDAVAAEQPKEIKSLLQMLDAARNTDEEQTTVVATMDRYSDLVVTQVRATYDIGTPPDPNLSYLRQDRFTEFAGTVSKENGYVHLSLVDEAGSVLVFRWETDTNIIKMTVEDRETVEERVSAQRPHPVRDEDVSDYRPERLAATREKITAFNAALDRFWSVYGR